MNKRGQVSIFVIVAIVIVGVISLLYVFPQINVFAEEINPTSYMRDCIKPELEDIIDVLSLQGGYYSPTNYHRYNDNKIQYLCYIGEDYKPCIIQQPLLKKKFEDEVIEQITPVANGCIANLKKAYDSRGYIIESVPSEFEFKIGLDGMVFVYSDPIAVKKEGTQTFRNIEIELESKLYDLLIISTSIIQEEASVGDSETLNYMRNYPDLKIVKIRREGTTIYEVSNAITKEKFSFATRSAVLGNII